jgi:hypothetical protein
MGYAKTTGCTLVIGGLSPFLKAEAGKNAQAGRIGDAAKPSGTRGQSETTNNLSI